jgi:hypothetical protein
MYRRRSGEDQRCKAEQQGSKLHRYLLMIAWSFYAIANHLQQTLP